MTHVVGLAFDYGILRKRSRWGVFSASLDRVSWWRKDGFMWLLLMVTAHKADVPVRFVFFSFGEMDSLSGVIAFFRGGA